ncbi:MAG: hypothetical protein JKX94_01580 [Sneathiella sp.]|nr:hypothetical protein [Sneathiella sp.]
MDTSLTTLKTQYETLINNTPDMRARNAAEALKVSEAELVACQMGARATRLISQAEAILKKIEMLGEVMALTRNEACVHERKGIYENPQFFTHGKMQTGLFVNPDIDLRLFMSHWVHIFALVEKTKSGPRKSLQFFDKSGAALHKIYLTNKSNEEAFDTLVAEFQSEDQVSALEIEAYAPKDAPRSNDDVDWAGFRETWENLKDTHDFFPMLRKFGVEREQGFRQVGSDFAYEVDDDAARRVIELARDTGCEIMVFTGNRGCIQIHTGAVKKLVDHGPWFNILDPKFNLHLNEDMIARIWVTRKPTVDGLITAVEIFDDAGEIIATLFGKRKPGEPELELWREIVSELPRKTLSNAA